MRIIPKLFVLTITSLLLAMPLSANGQVQVTDEASGTGCPSVTLGQHHLVQNGCPIHVVGTQETQVVIGTPNGPVVVDTCEEEFEGLLDGVAEGYFNVVERRDHTIGSPCTREACDEAAPSHTTRPWRFHFFEAGPGSEAVNIAFCLYHETAAEGTAGTTCIVNIPFTHTSHSFIINAAGGVGCTNLPAGAVTIYGRWQSEVSFHGANEITH